MILNLFDRMKLPFRKSKEFLKALYDILGFYPHDIEIYRIAFSHKSLTYRRDRNATDKRGNNRDKRNRPDAPTKPLNNERLEYLGDAVLETVVSDILFRHFSNKREGFLTSTRSKIVQREALNRLASQMGLETLIQAAQGTRMVHTNIGGNAFEALMGAIYLDRGYKFCHWFIENRVIGHYVDLDSVAQKEVNFKSKLLEWCQKNRINTNFRDSVNNDSERGFRSTIILEGITVGKGTGRSKKESQQVAAKDALTRMRKEQKLYDSIFRAKEKRTAMEADESFALPKIDEIESIISKDEKKRKPVLEGKPSEADENDVQQLMDSAYDEAYNEQADFEVIGNAEDESEYSEYATDIQPDATAEEVELSARTQPTAVLPEKKTEEGERPAPMTKAQRRRERNRSAKTVDDAVKNGSRKGKTDKVEKLAVAGPQEATVQPTDKEKKDNSKSNDRPNRKERVKAQESKEPKLDRSTAKQPLKQDVPDESTVEKDTDELITLQATILEDTEPTKAKPNGPVVNRVITEEDTTEVDTAESLSHTDIPTEENASNNGNDVRPDIEEAAERLSYLARKCVLETMHEDEDVLPLIDIPTPAAVETADEAPSAESHTSAENTEDECTLHQEENSTETVLHETEEGATEVRTPRHEAETAEEAKDNDVTVATSETETNNEAADEDKSDDSETDDVHEAEAEDYNEEEQAEEQEQLPSSVTDSEAARPILRHLTLDDFVFGTTDATTDDADAQLQEDEMAEGTLQDNKPCKSKSRRRRRKPQAQQQTDAMNDPAPQEDKGSQTRKRKPQPSKPNKAETEKQGQKQSAEPAESSMNEAEKTAKRKAAQRRRRRRENGHGKDTAQQAE